MQACVEHDDDSIVVRQPWLRGAKNAQGRVATSSSARNTTRRLTLRAVSVRLPTERRPLLCNALLALNPVAREARDRAAIGPKPRTSR